MSKQDLFDHVLPSLNEAKTSPAYNEVLAFSESQDGLNVRLDGSEGLHSKILRMPPAPGTWL